MAFTKALPISDNKLFLRLVFGIFFIASALIFSSNDAEADEYEEFKKEYAKQDNAAKALNKGKETQTGRMNEKLKTLDSKTQKVIKGETKQSKLLREKGNDASQSRKAVKNKEFIKKASPKNKPSTKLLTKGSKIQKIGKVAKSAAKGGAVVGAVLYAGKIANCGNEEGSVGDKIKQAGKNVVTNLGGCTKTVVTKDIKKTKENIKKVGCFGKKLFKKDKSC